MKSKILIAIMLVIFIIPVLNVSAEDSGKGPIGLDVGAIFSTGYLNDPLYPDLSALSIIYLMRGGITATGRYRINDQLSAGLETGLLFLTFEIGGTTTYFFDIPIQAVFRWGKDGTFLEPHVGYYLTLSGMQLGGFDVGVKGSLNNFYVDFSFIIGNGYNYPRFGLGYQINNIF